MTKTLTAVTASTTTIGSYVVSDTLRIRGGCVCPECGEGMTPSPPKRCTCPTMIYIPPGQHIHVDCELHGRTRLQGPSVSW